MFPKITRVFEINDPILKKALDGILSLQEDKRLVFFITEKIFDIEASKRYFYSVGVVSKIVGVHKNPNNNSYLIEAKGLYRAKILSSHLKEGELIEVEILLDEPANPTSEEITKIKNYIGKIKLILMEIKKSLNKLENWLPDNLSEIESLSDLEEVIYTHISHSFMLTVAEKQEILGINNFILRLAKIWNLLLVNLAILKVRDQILNNQSNQSVVQDDQDNKDSESLQEDSEYFRLSKKYRKIKSLIPKEIDQVICEDLERLRVSHQESAETAQIIAHIEFLLNFPWGRYTTDPSNFLQVKQILDEDHYGLEHVKERIIEFLAVKRLNPNSRGSIICFVGPPGVGKTSLGKSIARALNRKFVRISLGGVHDEAEIRGHRRTYIGALPGKIVHEIKRCGSLNPVFMIDEIDKIGREIHRGDPSSALLEALDPEQNFAFRDNYIGAGIDLSQVLFITTANILDTIQKPLLDRMEIIRLPGYTEFEKIQIAKKFLIPKQLKESGLMGKMNINFADDALSLIIRDYTDEAGVRELERKIKSIFGRVAKEFLLKISYQTIEINESFVKEVLGSKRFNVNKSRETPVGVAIGLAYTPSGGCILFIESARFISGQEKRLSQTGTLGDVFKESIKIALTLLRSRYFSNSGLDKYVFHVHVPAGGTPKDGPSAGITIFTSLYSLISEKKVKSNLAMTGEINLEGLVLPVGGIREKVIAAERAGIEEVILPFENRDDVEEIPQEIRGKLRFHFVRDINEVIEKAFD